MDGVKIVGEDKIIKGVKVVPLRRIPDERGTIYHMLRQGGLHPDKIKESKPDYLLILP